MYKFEPKASYVLGGKQLKMLLAKVSITPQG